MKHDVKQLLAAFARLDSARGEKKRAIRLFAEYMVRTRRLHLLPEITRILPQFLMRAKKEVRIEITSAQPVREAVKRAATRKAQELYPSAKGYTMKERIDPSVYGGVSIRIGDMRFDGSARGRLQGLRRTLTAAVHE